MSGQKQVEILIRFTDIPDHGRNAGWLCRPVDYKDGDPIGAGPTLREAFLRMLDHIEEQASEASLRRFAKPTGLEEK